MTEPKLLSKEELEKALRWTSNDPPGEKASVAILAHISALEADNAALVEKVVNLSVMLMPGPTAETTIRAGLAPHTGSALLEEHRKEVETLKATCEGLREACEDLGREAGERETKHRKALVRARNEGREEAAALADGRKANHMHNRTPCGPCTEDYVLAELIRAMKEPEPTEPA